MSVRTLGILVLTLGVAVGPAAVASAQQHVGVRAGVSGGPTQFYFGGDFETTPVIDHLTFRPNVEVGVGDHQTLAALNLEFAYHIPLSNQPWTLYFGAGPAVNWVTYRTGNPRFGNPTDVEGGFNLLVGVEHRGGLYTELKVGMIDSPSVKFGVGYHFR